MWLFPFLQSAVFHQNGRRFLQRFCEFSRACIREDFACFSYARMASKSGLLGTGGSDPETANF